MKKDNKKALYESIMTSVAKEVKKALNESLDKDFDPEEMEIHTAELANHIKENINSSDLNLLGQILCEDEYKPWIKVLKYYLFHR